MWIYGLILCSFFPSRHFHMFQLSYHVSDYHNYLIMPISVFLSLTCVHCAFPLTLPWDSSLLCSFYVLFMPLLVICSYATTNSTENIFFTTSGSALGILFNLVFFIFLETHLVEATVLFICRPLSSPLSLRHRRFSPILLELSSWFGPFPCVCGMDGVVTSSVCMLSRASLDREGVCYGKRVSAGEQRILLCQVFLLWHW